MVAEISCEKFETGAQCSPKMELRPQTKETREISHKRQRDKDLRCKRACDPETKVVEPVVGAEPVTVRRAEEDGSDLPRPAAHDTARTVGALDPGRAVHRCAAVAVVVAILRPLPDIAH